MKDFILVTGGAGFIGSNFILDWLETAGTSIVNLDALTYAGNRCNFAPLHSDQRHIFIHGDIGDSLLLSRLLDRYQPEAIIHFAAESHVDRSILAPDAFIRTNVNGTFALLEAAREYFYTLSSPERQLFRFLHVSTDEVYGSLKPDEAPFKETTAYAPNSPYSASKAASDHLVRAYFHTYGLPTITTNCSNNYGPFQFPEKLIPLMITNALEGKPLPIYGDGQNVRDWLFVRDHCAALRRVLQRGRPGETYNVGGSCERTNLEVVEVICGLLDELQPNSKVGTYRALVKFVNDRRGHDRRYAIDATKISKELGWEPQEDFESGLRKTVRWYLENAEWVNQVRSGAYQTWIDTNYANRGTSCGA